MIAELYMLMQVFVHHPGYPDGHREVTGSAVGLAECKQRAEQIMALFRADGPFKEDYIECVPVKK